MQCLSKIHNMENKLSEKIIGEINEHHIKPKPRWQFLLKRWVLWLFALLSVVLGGIAISIIISLFFDHDATAQVYLKQSMVRDILLTIPYFWLITLAILIGICKYAVAHTKFGYRYATIKIVGAVIVLSVLLGLVFNAFDVGQQVQDSLIENIPYYDSIVYTSKDQWSHPEKGLLGGTITKVISPQEFTLLDFHKKYWNIDMSTLDSDNTSIIKTGAIIKVIGMEKDSNTFNAQQIFPWDSNN